MSEHRADRAQPQQPHEHRPDQAQISRRRFLQSAGVATLGAAVLGVGLPSTTQVGPSDEYAKLVKIAASDASSRGFQTQLTLPSYKDWGGYGSAFINFYCGLGPLECGISTTPAFGGKWHWFVNGASNAPSGPYEYNDSAVVTILLALDEGLAPNGVRNTIVFKVNGVEKYRTPTGYSTPFSDAQKARLILATAQSRDVTPPLAPWAVTHYQVTAAQMKLKTATNVWADVTTANVGYSRFHWPSGVATNGTADYNVNFSYLNSSTVYASLNK